MYFVCRDSSRGARPTGRESIVAWYKEVEKLKGSGFDLRTGQVAPWFHGSRTVIFLLLWSFRDGVLVGGEETLETTFGGHVFLDQS